MKIKLKKFSMDYDHGCLMLDIKDPLHEFILSKISKEDLYEPEDPVHGLETRAHVTIAYGFSKQDYPMDVLNLASAFDEDGKVKVPDVTLKGISIFDCEDYDVLKWDVESNDLVVANTKIRSNYELDNDYDEFHPHCTLAYLKKGTADKYIEMFSLIHDIKVTPTQMAFSNAGEKEDYIYPYESQD